jgi:hypothetical protein
MAGKGRRAEHPPGRSAQETPGATAVILFSRRSCESTSSDETLCVSANAVAFSPFLDY